MRVLCGGGGVRGRTMAMCTQAVVSCVSVASSSILYMFFSSRSATSTRSILSRIWMWSASLRGAGGGHTG